VVPLLDEDGEVVRYPEGRPVRPGEIVYVMGHHRVDFVTGTALEVEGPMVEERFPAAGAQNVPPNLASVRVRFNEPAHNVTPATFQVVRPDGSAVGADEVLVTDGRLRAELVLSEALALSTEYRMVLRADIVDGIGNRLDERLNESTFTTAACEDHTPPEVDPASVQVLVADTYAVVSWRTNEPATGRVRFGAGVPTEEVAADSGACRYPNFDPCAEPPPDVECPHSALLEGLTPESLYAFEIENVDLAGNVTTTAAEEFTTSPPLPPLVINELLHGVVAPETAEFVEIYNAGEEEVDLEGWLIRDSSVEDPRTQVLGPFGSYDTVVAPGEYALLVGGAFDPALYPDLAATAILSGRSTTSGKVNNRLLSPGMASTRNIQLQLLTPDEVPVSTFGGWLRGGERRGIAIERIDALEPDVRDNWTWAQDPPGATPGYRNSVATGP
jgi:hypothetical protein